MSALASIGAAAIVACGGGDGDPEYGDPGPDYDKMLAGAPPRLAALHDQANELLPGGVDAFQRRLRELRGHPVVVNKWASWCGPCRFEFPFFQDQAAALGKRVAFIGVDSRDSDAAAKQFLSEFPVPYPSYLDPDEEIAASFEASLGFPSTAYFDRTGELVYTKQGGYATEADLAADIRRYALGGGT